MSDDDETSVRRTAPPRPVARSAPHRSDGPERARVAPAGFVFLWVSLVLALAIRLVYGPVFVSYDAAYALSWGADLAAGRAPSYGNSLPPTPHPLTVAVGVVLAPLGGQALDAAEWLASLALGCLGGAAFLLGRQVAGTAAGVSAAVLVLSRDLILFWGSLAYLDVLYTGLFLLAAWAALRSPRAPVGAFVLLLLAGLLRPEAWILSGALLIAVWWRRGRRLPGPATIALALAAPVLWVLFDLLTTGEPLYSFTLAGGVAEGGTAAGAGRDQAGDAGLADVAREGRDVIRRELIPGALLGAAVLWRTRNRQAAEMLVWGAVATAATAAVVLAGGPIVERFLFPGAAVACTLAAVAVAGLTRREPVLRVAGALALTAAAAGIAIDSWRYPPGPAIVRAERALIDDLRSLATTPEADRTVVLHGPGRLAPWLSLVRREPAASFAADGRPAPGAVIGPAPGTPAEAFSEVNGDFRRTRWRELPVVRRSAVWDLRRGRTAAREASVPSREARGAP